MRSNRPPDSAGSGRPSREVQSACNYHIPNQIIIRTYFLVPADFPVTDFHRNLFPVDPITYREFRPSGARNLGGRVPFWRWELEVRKRSSEVSGNRDIVSRLSEVTPVFSTNSSRLSGHRVPFGRSGGFTGLGRYSLYRSLQTDSITYKEKSGTSVPALAGRGLVNSSNRPPGPAS